MKNITQLDCFVKSLREVDHLMKILPANATEEQIAPFAALISALSETVPQNLNATEYSDEEKEIIERGKIFVRIGLCTYTAGYTDDERRDLFQKKSSAQFVCRIKEDGADNYFAHYVYLVDIDGVKKVKSCVPAHCREGFIDSLKKSDYYKSWF